MICMFICVCDGWWKLGHLYVALFWDISKKYLMIKNGIRNFKILIISLEINENLKVEKFKSIHIYLYYKKVFLCDLWAIL